jgi:cysteine-rich repeat protein
MLSNFRTLTLGALVLATGAGCASEATSIFCPTTGIVCPEGTVCAAAQPVCLATSCGNGVPDPGEQCDDGNIIDGDRCSALCRAEECGNNVIDQSAGEDCDDNNTVGGDGCSAQCRRESCGNGTTDVGEECDDGNLANQDGCTGTPIEISDGMGGTMRSPEPCMSREVCGNGIKDFQVGEVCDDGNTTPGDGCNSDCRSGEGCGNGFVDPGEECDDGDPDNNDRCRNDCKIATCGDGIVESTGNREQCDGGDTNNPGPVETAGCNIDCTTRVCGDGKVNTTGGEQCDKGAGQNANNRDCRADCQNNICTDGFQNTLGPLNIEACDDGDQDNFNECNNACQSASCGNMTIENGEMCDDGNEENTDSCIECATARCSDGFTQAGVEQCDDGDLDNGDGCSSTCRVEGCGNGILDPGEECDDNEVPSPLPGAAVNQNACVGQCDIARCGDGFLRTDIMGIEQCDDGNTTSGDGCSDTCRNEGCGNGQIDPGEQCDGGENPPVGGDGCDVNCQLEDCGDGFVDVGEQCDGNGTGTGGQTALCDIDCTFAVCDDFTINTTAGEQCDDGPTNNSDDRDCKSDCRNNTCTDGDLNEFGPLRIEGCDDGNQNNNDNCSNSCVSASCGNSTLNPGEECDDGNSNESDACTNLCRLNVCGDGKTRAGVEECDTNPATVGGFTYDCSPAAGASPSRPGCRLERCGNGVVDPGETCDDDLVAAGVSPAGEIAASFSGDGCNNECQVEFCGDGIENNVGGVPVEQCDGNGTGIGGLHADCNLDCTDSVCGDGKLNTLDGEQCDDDNLDPNDGCSPTCKFERCGNNTVDPGEQCDTLNGAGSSTCHASTHPLACLSISCGNGRVDFGETCDRTDRGCVGCQVVLYCGDGIITTTAPNNEQCDPPNTANCNFDCTTSTCGDGKVNPLETPSAETCDPGGGTPMDEIDCDDDCTANVCGDAHEGFGEECDNGGSNSYTAVCLPTCEDNVCGDGYIDAANEACDDGNTMTETEMANCTGYNTSCLFCDSTCDNPLSFEGPHCGDGQCNNGETNALCAVDCLATCGDGVVGLGEVCDYGSETNDNAGTDCPTMPVSGNGQPPGYGQFCIACDSCLIAVPRSGAYCGDGTCQGGSGETAANCGDCTQSCGDNLATGTESCDGTDLNEQDCGDFGFTSGTLACFPNSAGPSVRCTYDISGCTPLCGNGILEGSEDCDDDDRSNGDGCSSTCVTEDDWTCTGTTPSVCTCDNDDACAMNQFCNGSGACVGDLGMGVACDRDAQCANGDCDVGGTNTCN